MEFRLWLEKQFLELPQEAKESIEHLIQNLPTISYQKVPIRIGKVFKGYNYKYIPVYLANISSDGVYDHDKGVIYLKYGVEKNPSKMRQILQHELIHSVDRAKVHDRSSYQQNIGTNAYFNEPTEFNAYAGTLAQHIRDEVARMTPNKRHETITGLKNWLRTNTTTKQGIFGWIKSVISTPNILINFHKMQRAWQTDPKLWRNFKQKLYNLTQQLESMYGQSA